MQEGGLEGAAHKSRSTAQRHTAGLDFVWYHLPSHGGPCGIPLGVNKHSLHAQKDWYGGFCVKFQVHSMDDGFEWVPVAIYGASQPELKPVFLVELVHMCSSETLPMLLGGFNIIRCWDENNNDNFYDGCPFMFNGIIKKIWTWGRLLSQAISLPGLII